MRKDNLGIQNRYRDDYQMMFKYSEIQESDLIIDIASGSIFLLSGIK
jgi:hypothetical protein